MPDKTKYYNGVGYPDLTDMFVQHALRMASKTAPTEQDLLVLRHIFHELASIYQEANPDKLVTKMGLALALETGDEVQLPLSE